MPDLDTDGPDLSVVVPAYDVAAYLPQCLGSLVHQTLERIEVIVVDDGSKDGSAAVAEDWHRRFPDRVRVIRQANGGCGAARAAGLAAARGRFVGFVDGDDWVSLGMFERLLDAARRHRCDIAQCGYAEVYPDGARVVPEDPAKEVLRKAVDLAADRPTIWRRIYRRAFLEAHAIGFPVHVRNYDDTAFQFETLARATAVVVIPHVGYSYRQGRAGQDIGARDERLFAFLQIFAWLEARDLAGVSPHADRQLLRTELNCHAWALSRIRDDLRVGYREKAIRHLARRRRHLTLLQSLVVAWTMYGAARTLMVAAAALRLRQPGRSFLAARGTAAVRRRA